MVSWSCVVYNPQSTKKHGRMRDIARNFRWNDFIALPGTHTRQQDSSKPCIMQSVGKHRLYCWGSGKGAHVNESCGVTLGIKHRSFPERSVVRIFSPPPELQGRGGAVRIERGDADITPIVVYVPTEPNSRKDQAASKAIWQWVHELLSSLPSRTVPVLMLDANGKTGLRHNAVGNFHENFDDSAIGCCNAALETYNGSLFHTCLLDHHMFAVNTFYDVGPTWHGWTFEGLSSRIEYICLPQSLRAHVKSCRILQQCGDALQNMVRPGRCDHRPLQVVFGYKLCFDHHAHSTTWNRTMLVQCLAGGRHREEFARQVEGCCSDPGYCWDSCILHPDFMWQQLQNIVHDAAKPIFEKSRKARSCHLPDDTAEALQQREHDRLAVVQLHNVTVFFRWVCVAMVQTASVGKDCLNCFNNGSFVRNIVNQQNTSDIFPTRQSEMDRRTGGRFSPSME